MTDLYSIIKDMGLPVDVEEHAKDCTCGCSYLEMVNMQNAAWVEALKKISVEEVLEKPDQHFEFICEWFQKGHDNALKQGRKESALLWADGLTQIKYYYNLANSRVVKPQDHHCHFIPCPVCEAKAKEAAE